MPAKPPFLCSRTFAINLQLWHRIKSSKVAFAGVFFGDVFTVQVSATRIGNVVTVQIPGFSTFVPRKAGASFIFSPDTPVPRCFRPTTAMPISFAISTHLTNNPPTNDARRLGDLE